MTQTTVTGNANLTSPRDRVHASELSWTPQRPICWARKLLNGDCMLRRTILLSAALAMSGCGDLFEDDPSDSDLRINFSTVDDATPADRLTIRFDGNGWMRTVRGNELLPPPPGVTPQTNFSFEFQIPNVGAVAVTVLLQEGRDTIVHYNNRFSLSDNSRYILHFFLGQGDPRKRPNPYCPSLVDYALLRRPMTGVRSDTLYISWFGSLKGLTC
jgi:hypothetical protein